MIFIFISLFSIFFTLGLSPVWAINSNNLSSSVESLKPQVLLMNQVRGSECCEPGNVDFFREQLNSLEEKKLRSVFNLRFDALKDPVYQQLINESNSEFFNWGIFLEITPDLAEEAGVSYLGQENNWYEAQHAYTLGYSLEERKSLIDVLMAEYENFFGYYPNVTTSWIIDTPTLNYLADEYGIKVHQLTREQWGTDSYTLYGGPPHYPYFASRNWAFMPVEVYDQSILIVRQTLTDPVWNYGDTQARFTSQPNDFTQDGKSFSYFEQLLNQALFKQITGQRGFALLGLENSMAAKYQRLYQKQLDLIAELAMKDEITLPKLADLRSNWSESKVNVYLGEDFVKDSGIKAFWITTKTYRLRLLKKNQQIMIDDLRIYDPKLKDYYSDHQAQIKAYWISPFLLDGSRYYTQEKSWFAKEQASDGQEPLPDLITQPQSWKLPVSVGGDFKFNSQDNNQTINLTYQTKEGKVKLFFASNRFGMSKLIGKSPRLIWSLDGEEVYKLEESCDDDFCWYQPKLNPKLFSQAQETQHEAFLPEQKVGQLDDNQSKLYAHNPYAVAGKNPVRLVFMPKDENGVGVQLQQTPEIKIESNGVVLETNPSSVLTSNPQFYDLSSQEPLKTKIIFQVNDELELETKIFFAPNCRENWQLCWRKPNQFWWYLRSLLGNKWRSILEKWQSWRSY